MYLKDWFSFFKSGKKKVYEEDNCYCTENDNFETPIGPFCRKWLPTRPRYCLLNGSLDTRFCPGAVLLDNSTTSITYSESVCRKSEGRFLCFYGHDVSNQVLLEAIIYLFHQGYTSGLHLSPSTKD